MPICQPLGPHSRALLEAEARTAMRDLQGWELHRQEGLLCLGKRYATANFRETWALAERVTRLAEAENHHPEIILRYHYCQVRWWTQALGGVHDNDIRMAAATDAWLYGETR